ncbi:MAG: prolyl-tRNA synthetase [Candidatus Vogelbacteria bacterium CG10_big_fil_rev_8_21_14_0_10_51_16]|uniref:Proline--tRNA ligase n=1 Tax=Candidatus Vogelbacteria bacterium CG10_big_fil_rev_8_21_14_0_10_51_16 TaxID=1975045 RepID=A0A2H0RGD2_9BACT|nr:MAG: prolyl-tRNA synthetase [Candidatus Vogelbacteria bacterium CG10_big_fil_rev_8_21_14_0_10_51_16]
MLQSQLFTKPRKEAPKDEVAKNAALLVRAGFIDKLQAGVYSYLPLGLLVIKKIEQIIREEINAVGGQELLMPALHPKEVWQTTGRWDSLDVLYKIKDASDREFALGPTHEEIVVPLVKQFVSSYKDLPFSVYQFQNKFRMELRAKSGILRGREFLMKDLYSFHRDEEDLKQFYEKMKGVYVRIFERCGIGAETHLTFASGGSFSQYSHEYQTVTPAGEDIIYVCGDCGVAINDEIIAKQSACPACGSTKRKSERSIEVGNIFELKTKFSDPFGLTYKDEKGDDKPVVMGCYGIGLGRVMGAVVEVFGTENAMRWPDSLSPHRLHLLELTGKGSAVDSVRKVAGDIYQKLTKAGVSVLYDDRNARAGEKFADADLIGIPHRVVVSEKLVADNKLEYLNRVTGEKKIISEIEFFRLFTNDMV